MTTTPSDGGTRDRITISLSRTAAERVRRCASGRGGASAYLEHLVRQDAMGEALRDAGQLYATEGYSDPETAGTELDAALQADGTGA